MIMVKSSTTTDKISELKRKVKFIKNVISCNNYFPAVCEKGWYNMFLIFLLIGFWQKDENEIY